MIWTAETPIYLPLTYPPSILAAAERLADDVERALGARPELRPQPAPFGRPAVLIAPDPAYTAAVAPNLPETFVARTDGPELTVTGADNRGNLYGLAWLALTLLELGPDEAWSGVATPRDAVEIELDHEQPAWPEATRAWAVEASDFMHERDRLIETLLRSGGNTLAIVGDEADLAERALAAGLLVAPADEATVTRATVESGRAPRWW